MLLTLVLGAGVALVLGAGPAGSAFAEETTGTIPDLSARDLDGKKVDLRDAITAPTVIIFWATWCKPCRKEMPELERLVERYREQGLSVVAINGDGPVDQAKIRPYVKALGFTFTVIPDPDGEIRRRFQVEVFPTSFLVDGEGRIVHRQVGYRRGDEKILEARIRELLSVEAAGEEMGG